MGKPSNTNPTRRSARLREISRICVAIAIAACWVATADAQTQATSLPLVLPSAIVFDPYGNLYFADAGSHVVRELTLAGTVTAIAGSGVQGFAGDGGPATAAEIDSPGGLALDSAGNLYIADSHNHRIREVSAATGIISTVAGTGKVGYGGDNGPATAAQLDLPTALAFDVAGNLYLADTGNHRIRRIAASTGGIATVAGNGVEAFAGDTGTATAASIDSPNGLALDSAGNLYIADTHNGRVRMVSAATGLISTIAGAGVSGGSVQAFGGDGGAATLAGLALPRGLSMDAAGNLYIADSDNHRIRRVSSAGVMTTIAGQGTQAFVGDGAPAVAASLDTPGAVAISPGGLVTLADTGNQRLRQVDALPAPGPDIHTIGGVGGAVPGTLTLSGPSVVAYGSGTLTASLPTTTAATGSVTFLDGTAGTATVVGSANFASGFASFSTASLAAGLHTVVAVYSGDGAHAAAQSSAFALTVIPISVTATATPASILYGQTIPTLGGTLNGVLPQDAVKVAVQFSTTAIALSPVGIYPIAATLTGNAAANYTLVLTPVGFVITRAPSLDTFALSSINFGMGAPVAMTIQVASTTSGVPTGSITLLDGSTTLAVVPLSVTGSAAFSVSTLAMGSHSLSVAYPGDANFLPSTSSATTLTVGAPSDFTLAASSPTLQSVPAGSAATFTFAIAMQGAALSSPIMLAVQGTPPGATVSLNPISLPPGAATGNITLTIQTPFAQLDQPARPFAPNSGVLAILLLPAVGLLGRRRLRRSVLLAIVGVASCALLTTGCGNRVNVAADSSATKTYAITVTATATGPTGAALQHSVTVNLSVL